MLRIIFVPSSKFYTTVVIFNHFFNYRFVFILDLLALVQLYYDRVHLMGSIIQLRLVFKIRFIFILVLHTFAYVFKYYIILSNFYYYFVFIDHTKICINDEIKLDINCFSFNLSVLVLIIKIL